MTKSYLSPLVAETKQMFPEHRVPTGKDEWYTPAPVIEAARRLMGSIDLDPASCETANQVVKATRYFTISDDALQQDWSGNVWCNPPFGARLVRAFHAKLKDSPAVSKACFLSPLLDSKHSMAMLQEADAIVFLRPYGGGWWGPAVIHKSPPSWGLLGVACYGVTIEETRQAFGGLGVVR